MMSLLYAPSSSGKTLAALAAFPNAPVATTKLSNVLDPARLYGLDIDEDQVTIVKSVRDLKNWAMATKGQARIIDELSDVLENEVITIGKHPDFSDNFAVYGELKNRVVPFFRSLSKKEEPLVITCWTKKAAEKKDLEGDAYIEPQQPALPGTSIRDTIPGLCEHVFRIAPQEPPASDWPFQFQCRRTSLALAKCRAPASVPEYLPLALSAVYRASGYECDPMFPEQERVREAAYKALTGDRRAAREAMGKMFAKLEKDGVNLHAASYAVIEAQVQIALEEHAASLAKNLAGSFF